MCLKIRVIAELSFDFLDLAKSFVKIFVPILKLCVVLSLISTIVLLVQNYIC